MAKECDMNEVIKTEEGCDTFMGDRNEQPFVLLLRVTQSNGKPLPIGGFTGRAMSQMLNEFAGVVQVEGALATHTEEAVQSAVIGSVRGAAHEHWSL